MEILDLCNQIEEFTERGRIGVWKVLSRCEKTGEVAYRIVTNTFCRRVEKAYSVVYLDAFGIRGVIYTTPEHPFWIVDKGWVLAGELQIGDVVKTIDGFVTVFELDDANWGGDINVYNLEVEGFNTYFVGEDGLWVHNCNEKSGLAVKTR
jgi:hypothetical protein